MPASSELHLPTIKDVLASATARLTAAAVDSPRLNAELLLGHALGCNRSALYAKLHDPLGTCKIPPFEDLLGRRMAREPLQYLVGHQEFWSLDFIVSPDVLIPRPESERIIELALSCFPQARNGMAMRVCDIGTGSGCLAISLAHEWAAANVTAVDISAAALRLAAVNADRHRVAGRISLLQSDLLCAVRGRFDLIVANPPYVSAADLAGAQPELAAEPRQALHGGDSGLEAIRRLLPQVPERLQSGGCLLMEIGADQGEAVAALSTACGAAEAVIEKDHAGLPRVLCARW